MMRVTSLMGPMTTFMPQIFRAAHTDAGGRSSISGRCDTVGSSALKKLSIVRPDNEAAFTEIRDKFGYPLMPGTSNVYIINPERFEAALRRKLILSILDFDETVSLIKCGWQMLMPPYIGKMWAMSSSIPPHLAWQQKILLTALDAAFSEEITRRTTGTLTRVQFGTAIKLKQYRDPISGGIDRAIFERALDGILTKGPSNFYEPVGELWDAEEGNQLYDAATRMLESWKEIMKIEFRDKRLAELLDGISQPEEYLTGSVIPFLNALDEFGILKYGLSGSEEADVKEDSAALRIGRYFRYIFGDKGIFEGMGKEYTKKTGSIYVMDQEKIQPNEKDRVMMGGDGPSELATCKELGGFGFAFVPEHVEDPVALARTLLKEKPDVMVTKNWSDWPVFVPRLFANLKVA